MKQKVGERLEDLYGRQREVPPDEIDGFYTPGTGYRGVEDADGELDVFGVCLTGSEGNIFGAGDFEQGFPLQSISKVIAYGLALDDHGRDAVLERVGVEPSGEAFNSLEFDESHQRPFNPMVNAGALVTTDLIKGSSSEEKLERFIETLSGYTGRDDHAADAKVFEAELKDADHNRAAAYLMRSNEMLDGKVEDVIELYLHQCSVHVTARDLAVMAATLANGCINPLTGRQAGSPDRTRDLLSVMYTCGMYDFAGEWAYSVGFPAKSGVSGGVLAVVPGKMGIGVFSPGLDANGNSVRGIRVCQELSERLGLHVFASEAEDSLLGRAGQR